eukprot:COSAG02_NODE_799_length_17084_cov_9.741242_9_plen_79_part_00
MAVSRDSTTSDCILIMRLGPTRRRFACEHRSADRSKFDKSRLPMLGWIMRVWIEVLGHSIRFLVVGQHDSTALWNGCR